MSAVESALYAAYRLGQLWGKLVDHRVHTGVVEPEHLAAYEKARWVLIEKIAEIERDEDVSTSDLLEELRYGYWMNAADAKLAALFGVAAVFGAGGE